MSEQTARAPSRTARGTTYLIGHVCPRDCAGGRTGRTVLYCPGRNLCMPRLFPRPFLYALNPCRQGHVGAQKSCRAVSISRNTEGHDRKEGRDVGEELSPVLSKPSTDVAPAMTGVRSDATLAVPHRVCGCSERRRDWHLHRKSDTSQD